MNLVQFLLRARRKVSCALGAENDTQALSSEAAVLYVGMTRARDLLYLSHSTADQRGKPLLRSSFIDRIARWCDFAEFKR
jgi:superfamily I DNA/RNA helicase